ncbi:hypothetical protein CYMTET_39096 [Cymbomonas tetramitiformis]|uniref:Uncharacterized protein n=1 Tax=Cymbomonas tetramitiformis TaxID=36881 RepID=A0AAE0CCZ3_9CHLO|nr:hypothetical protein CYMTET_39096 [Cymbomonas tetramitiformis]
MPLGSSSTSWFPATFGFEELSFSDTRKQFTIDEANILTSKSTGQSFLVGPFECLSTNELRIRLQQLNKADRALGPATFHNIADNVRSLHQDPKNSGALFQVASQFNCLEMVGPSISPQDGISRYSRDPTQGPACALACPAATLFRNYFVSGHGQAKKQLDLLDEAAQILQNDKYGYWDMMNGYCLPRTTQSMAQIGASLSLAPDLASAVRSAIKVGVHWNTEVANHQHQVCQVFCSALPVAYSKATPSSDWEPFATLVLEAAYECTLAVASYLALQRGQRVTVYLTCLGGGAFGNRVQWILKALSRALLVYQDSPLDIKLVHFMRNPSSDFVSLEKRFVKRSVKNNR